jgi:hypothetical protein
MKRDFPEHYLLSKTTDHKDWYKDLYEFGAYFGLRTSIPLLPHKLVCTGPGVRKNIQNKKKSLAQPIKIMTTRKRTSESDFLRYPHQNFVALEDKRTLNSKQTKILLTLDQKDINHTNLRLIPHIFLHCQKKLQCFVMNKISKWKDIRFDAIVFWMLTHFEVEKANWDDGIEFLGKLRKGHILEPNPQGMSESLWLQTKVYKFGSHDDLFEELCMYCDHINHKFISANGECIPSWNTK